jgi:hypothetical protein
MVTGVIVSRESNLSALDHLSNRPSQIRTQAQAMNLNSCSSA